MVTDDNIVAGIKEAELIDLAKEVMKYCDSIGEILNEYDNKFCELDQYYQGKSLYNLKDLYLKVRDQFPIVKNNIMSYSDDFIALIGKMNEGGDKLARMFEQFTAERDKKISTIDENYLKEN